MISVLLEYIIKFHIHLYCLLYIYTYTEQYSLMTVLLECVTSSAKIFHTNDLYKSSIKIVLR